MTLGAPLLQPPKPLGGELRARVVAALLQASAYPQVTRHVELVETHHALVFLTDQHAYKLGKQALDGPQDEVTLDRQRRTCERDLQLNRRLGGDAYQGVTAVVHAPPGYRVGGPGPVVAWLLKMRRLRRHLMLDVAIAEGSVSAERVDALATTLLSFYARAEPVPLLGPVYRRRLLADVEAKHASLVRRCYGLQPAHSERLAAALTQWIAQHEALIELRAARVVDAHGDLRPEHICLEPQPIVIDCLELDDQLRQLDPISELAFLGLECRRLGAPWIEARLIELTSAPVGLQPTKLFRFYQAYHALVRAAVAIWHLDDPVQRRPDVWRARATQYLMLGLERLCTTPGCEGRSSDDHGSPALDEPACKGEPS